MTDKIWFEMIDMKYGEIYLTKYLGLQRTFKKTFNIMTLVLSVSGIFGWKFFEDYAWIAFALIAVMQLFTLIENQIILSDKEIDDISELKMCYTKYFNKLEKLWTEHQRKRIDDDISLDKFFDLKTSDWENIQQKDGKLNIKNYMFIIKKTDVETNNYINKFHNYE
jgi:hypothetical protein